MPKTAPQQDLDQLRAALELEQSARAELEDRLRRSRSDFQEFASRISHDLREPLRTVGVYSQLISSKNTGEDEDANLYLSYIQDAVERTQALLAAMLEYAAVEAEPLHPVAVDMNSVYSETLRRINPAAPVSVSSDPLPVVSGDFEMLTRTLRHLIDNGIKFAGRPDAQIHISARRNDREWIISVRDNGPGIEAAHRDKIFGLFRRLHGREFPGTGLGLAFSRSVVQALGGDIWVEPAPEQGSIFCFSLPPAD
jgi:signal transduction histidine kinase